MDSIDKSQHDEINDDLRTSGFDNEALNAEVRRLGQFEIRLLSATFECLLWGQNQ